MKNKPLTRMGLILAALGALTSFSFAQAPPRSGEVFSVWSSGNQVLSSRHFAGDPANEVTPGPDVMVTGLGIPLTGNHMLLDEPQGVTSHQPCFRIAALSNLQQFHGHC